MMDLKESEKEIKNEIITNRELLDIKGAYDNLVLIDCYGCSIHVQANKIYMRNCYHCSVSLCVAIRLELVNCRGCTVEGNRTLKLVATNYMPEFFGRFKWIQRWAYKRFFSDRDNIIIGNITKESKINE